MLGRPKATKADADLACERSWLLPVRRGLPGIPIRREEVQLCVVLLQPGWQLLTL
jgi:hypothetical protein